MSFEKLSKKNKQLIIDQYSSNKPRKTVQKELSKFLNVTRRTIRNYARELNIGVKQSEIVDEKIMVYDIETSCQTRPNKNRTENYFYCLEMGRQ